MVCVFTFSQEVVHSPNTRNEDSPTHNGKCCHIVRKYATRTLMFWGWFCTNTGTAERPNEDPVKYAQIITEFLHSVVLFIHGKRGMKSIGLKVHSVRKQTWQ